MIRDATGEEAGALARIERRAWMRLWGDALAPDDLPSLEDRRRRLDELVAPPGRTLVFDQDGVVAGFASIGPARDGDLAPEVGELLALHVDPPAQGAGVGGALLEAACDLLREAGSTAAALWVLEANEPARDLYQRRGWQLDGDQRRELLWAPEVRYRRTL